jgi:hypothetical protein
MPIFSSFILDKKGPQPQPNRMISNPLTVAEQPKDSSMPSPTSSGATKKYHTKSFRFFIDDKENIDPLTMLNAQSQTVPGTLAVSRPPLNDITPEPIEADKDTAETENYSRLFGISKALKKVNQQLQQHQSKHTNNNFYDENTLEKSKRINIKKKFKKKQMKLFGNRRNQQLSACR